MVYLDDIITVWKTFGDHWRDFIQISVQLLSHGISVKPSKRFFCQEQVLYLGHVISGESV